VAYEKLLIVKVFLLEGTVSKGVFLDMRMANDGWKRTMLDGYTVLDLTNEMGFFCGRILADLGADVIKVEPPSGEASRMIGPFYQDDMDPEKSLYWFAYNGNKRGITLDVQDEEGRNIFRKLVNHADIVIESFCPGHMQELGLGYAELESINSGIIVTSISPYGQTGPYKGYRASDITCMAMGGLMYLSGYPDLPPVRVSAPQAYLQGGAEAAVGTVSALFHRENTRKGQHVDVSIQESIMFCMLNLHLFWESHGEVIRRQGDSRIFSSGAKHRQIWPCKDGYVCFTLMGARAGAETNIALVEWMDSEGMATEYLKQKDWYSFDFAVAKQEELDLIGEPILEFFGKYTKEELTRGASKRRMMFYPVTDISDILGSSQLSERAYWQKVEHPELGKEFVYPGHFCFPSDTVCSIRRRAPLVGEHNMEVFQEMLGIGEQEVNSLKARGII
jgi:crotonobetainyl-CoA:carnitine CoA-transferase CaiB-like acyl-CoA transferase